jgi:Uma2 family endonuclease
MSVPARKPPHSPMSLDEFLAWEAEQELRYEFDGFQPVAMTGGTIAHSEIATALVEVLHRRLRGLPCRALRGDLKILVAGRARYPDAVVTCAPLPPDAVVIPEPVIVFKILSASTASMNPITKNEEYRATPSIQRYVMLEQTRMAATVFERSRTDWIGHILSGDAVLQFLEIGIELPLAEIYEGIELASGPTD